MVIALKSAVRGSGGKKHVSPCLLKKVHQFTIVQGERKRHEVIRILSRDTCELTGVAGYSC